MSPELLEALLDKANRETTINEIQLFLQNEPTLHKGGFYVTTCTVLGR
jgi:hypothetical protein